MRFPRERGLVGQPLWGRQVKTSEMNQQSGAKAPYTSATLRTAGVGAPWMDLRAIARSSRHR
jgi:hypothetical protein